MDQIVDQADVLQERLLSAIGKRKLSAERRAVLKTWLREFKRAHDARWHRTAVAEVKRRKRLYRKMLALNAKRSKLRQQLGMDGKLEIARAAWIRTGANPFFFDAIIHAREPARSVFDTSNEKLKEVDQLERLEELEEQDIRYVLNEMVYDYHKPRVRKYVLEPFLMMLLLWTRAQPFTDAVKALFDWLGIERKFRPSDTSIRAIVRELKRDDLPRLRGSGNVRARYVRSKKMTQILIWRTKSIRRRINKYRKIVKISAWRLKALKRKLKRKIRLVKISAWLLKHRPDQLLKVLAAPTR